MDREERKEGEGRGRCGSCHCQTTYRHAVQGDIVQQRSSSTSVCTESNREVEFERVPESAYSRRQRRTISFPFSSSFPLSWRSSLSFQHHLRGCGFLEWMLPAPGGLCVWVAGVPTGTRSEHRVWACAPEPEAAFDPKFARSLGEQCSGFVCARQQNHMSGQ